MHIRYACPLSGLDGYSSNRWDPWRDQMWQLDRYGQRWQLTISRWQVISVTEFYSNEKYSHRPILLLKKVDVYISEREFMFMFAICRRPSVCRLSVCLSSVTFVHPTQPIEIFGNGSAPCNTLVTWRHPGKILRRSSQGNPSVGGLNQRVLETRNSSGDEIANVNFLYDDIVHVIQNTIDLCINSATARRSGYVL